MNNINDVAISSPTTNQMSKMVMETPKIQMYPFHKTSQIRLINC